MNFLERLVADWYGHQGYLVQTNLNFGKRAKGGYTGEIDVLALNLKTRELVHVETSGDADSWEERRERMLRKFKDAKEHYYAASGIEFESVKQIAVVGVRPRRKSVILEGIDILSVDELIGAIKKYVGAIDPATHSIPERFGYLRAIQYAEWYGKDSTYDAKSSRPTSSAR